jgi:hypothetical protein
MRSKSLLPTCFNGISAEGIVEFWFSRSIPSRLLKSYVPFGLSVGGPSGLLTFAGLPLSFSGFPRRLSDPCLQCRPHGYPGSYAQR